VTSVFSIEMLPAYEGDCLWIEYGDASRPRVILCDGGRKVAYKALRPRLRRLAAEGRAIELLIVSHIDADHIEGILELLDEDEFPIQINDVWFNGYDHLRRAARMLPKSEIYGAVQAEKLTKNLRARGWPWNKAFHGAPAARVGDEVPAIELAGGMSVRLVSPTLEALRDLIPTWEKECADAGIPPGGGRVRARRGRDGLPAGAEIMGAAPRFDVMESAREPFVPDSSKANRSSIAVLLEYRGRRALMTGDAHADLLLSGLRAMRGGRRKLRMDVFKLSHHGSHGTTSLELMENLDAAAIMVSTNGSRHKHPHRQSLARWLTTKSRTGVALFNYDQKEAGFWNNRELRRRYDYEVRFPEPARDGYLKHDLI